MKPVYVRLTPDKAFYKQTVREWEGYFGVETDLEPDTVMARAEFIRKAVPF